MPSPNGSHDDPAFTTLSTDFLNSFKSQPTATFHSSLTISDLRHRSAGRGILATASIPPDSILFTIPRSHIISVSTSELTHKLPDLFTSTFTSSEDDLPKPWLDLILVLLYEYFHQHTSAWSAYWAVLPHEFNTLMFWTEPELRELQASDSRAKIGRDDADRMFRERVVPVVLGNPGVFFPEGVVGVGEGEVLSLAHRMGSLIMAYAFDLEAEDEEEEMGEDGWVEDKDGQMGMVPMADMLNADAEFNAHLEHGETELTMRSLREIREGEEVLNYYGPLPNSELLRRYGYTSAKHARYDVVEVRWEGVRRGMGKVLGKVPDVIVEEGEMESSFVLERESGEPDDTGRHQTEAKFTTFPEDLVDQVTLFTSAAIGAKGKPNEEQKRKLKELFLKIMAVVIPDRLAEYATTIDQDEVMLQDEKVVGRKRMAIDVRLGEKRLLKEAGELVRQLLNKYTSVAESDTNTERPTKKLKTKR